MSGPLRRRVDAIEKTLTPDRIDRLERMAAEAAVWRRIDNWCATRADFEILMAPGVNKLRQELVADAVAYAVQRWIFGPPSVDEWRPQTLAAAVVYCNPASPEQLAAIAALEVIARPVEGPAPDWCDPTESAWCKANEYLVALGTDQGASLHEEAADATAAARETWVKEREQLAEKIASGEAKRLDFMVWVQPDLNARREQLVAQARERRSQREAGHPLGIHDVYDVAAEIASYLPQETVPERAVGNLSAARDQEPIAGTRCHEEWVQANELHWVVGPGGGSHSRLELERLLAKDQSGGAPSTPPRT